MLLPSPGNFHDTMKNRGKTSGFFSHFIGPGCHDDHVASLTSIGTSYRLKVPVYNCKLSLFHLRLSRTIDSYSGDHGSFTMPTRTSIEESEEFEVRSDGQKEDLRESNVVSEDEKNRCHRK